MTDDKIRFDDGAAYERYMGLWSRKVGEQFLNWLSAVDGMRWLDVGCGNGAFTEMLAQHCAPSALAGIDPSEEQLAFARTLPALANADLRAGDAMALPWADRSFDAAVMPLVIFFVPEPRRGVSEMARVVAPGGLVTAYAWDMAGGGFPYAALQAEIAALGITVPTPPSNDASKLEVMQTLWQDAGLCDVETTVITVQREFASFDDYWETVQGGPSVRLRLAGMTPEIAEALKKRMREILPTDDAGKVTVSASANVIKGCVAL
ncbi:MAG: class I SAM-dependent methyltransferase [Pedobacter sp.]|nr:class I SAM-dependent methyltransferase [Pedobacter sp.]